MTNKFEQKLNLPFVFNLNINETVFKSVPYYIEPTSSLNDWLASLNCEIAKSGPELFYMPPGHAIPIHSDGRTFDNKVKLNFQYRGKGSVMKWYVPVDLKKIATDNPVEFSSYASINYNNAVLVHAAEIGHPSIVNAGVFHNVENGNDHRWTVSIPVWNLDTMTNLQWEEAMDKFKPWLQSL